MKLTIIRTDKGRFFGRPDLRPPRLRPQLTRPQVDIYIPFFNWFGVDCRRFSFEIALHFTLQTRKKKLCQKKEYRICIWQLMTRLYHDQHGAKQK